MLSSFTIRSIILRSLKAIGQVVFYLLNINEVWQMNRAKTTKQELSHDSTKPFLVLWQSNGSIYVKVYKVSKKVLSYLWILAGFGFALQ